MERRVVEVGQFKLVDGVGEQDFITEAERVQQAFLSKQEGYLNRELLKDGDGQWFDILHWSSLEAAQAAAQALLQGPACRQCVQMIDQEHPDVPS